MNIFNSLDKVEHIDSVIRLMLDKSTLDWSNLKLYSWHWNESSQSYLSPQSIYGSNKLSNPMAIHDSKNDPMGIIATLYDSKKRTYLGLVKDRNILLDLEVKLFSSLPAENFVVTSICPNKSGLKLFPADTLYSSIGKWYTGLR